MLLHDFLSHHHMQILHQFPFIRNNASTHHTPLPFFDFPDRSASSKQAMMFFASSTSVAEGAKIRLANSIVDG